MCWVCAADQESMRDGSLDATWRANRWTPEQFAARLRAASVKGCPLFAVPGFSTALVLPDWLHTCDLGVAADTVGQFLWWSLHRLPGNNNKARVSDLWGRVQEYYRATRTASKLHALSLEMIRKPGGKPKLRGKAAQIRALVPFAAQLAHQICKVDVAEDVTVKNCVCLLATLYGFLDQDHWPAELAAQTARRFFLLHAELEKKIGRWSFLAIEAKVSSFFRTD